jgi:short-subunit dehydrogenase
MRTWSQALNLELKRFGIKVLCVTPGSTQTEIFSNSLGRAPKTHRNPGKVVHPEKVSQKIIKAAVSSRGELVISLSDKMILLLSRVIPGVLNKLIKYTSASEDEHIYGDRRS